MADKTKTLDRINLSGFLREYLVRGFGLMPKREIDITIFSELLAQGHFGDDPNHYEISRILKIPESKVAGLLYEADLRRVGSDEDAWIRAQLASHRTPVQNVQTKGVVKIYVANKLLRSCLEARVVSLGGVPDLSSSPRVFVVDHQTFGRLLENILTDEQAKSLKAAMIKVKAIALRSDMSLGALTATFLSAVAKEGGKRVYDLPSFFFDGGIGKMTKSLVNTLKDLFKGS